jgi:hypothetical protein
MLGAASGAFRLLVIQKPYDKCFIYDEVQKLARLKL